jgi:hypothetical protein
LVLFVPLSVLLWLISAALFFLCAKFLVVRGIPWSRADPLLRATAFAYIPQIAAVAVAYQGFGAVWQYACIAWLTGAMTVAIRQSLHTTTGCASMVIALTMTGILSTLLVVVIAGVVILSIAWT